MGRHSMKRRFSSFGSRHQSDLSIGYRGEVPDVTLVGNSETLSGKGTDWDTTRDKDERISTNAVWLKDETGSKG